MPTFKQKHILYRSLGQKQTDSYPSSVNLIEFKHINPVIYRDNFNRSVPAIVNDVYKKKYMHMCTVYNIICIYVSKNLFTSNTHGNAVMYVFAKKKKNKNI